LIVHPRSLLTFPRFTDRVFGPFPVGTPPKGTPLPPSVLHALCFPPPAVILAKAFSDTGCKGPFFHLILKLPIPLPIPEQENFTAPFFKLLRISLPCGQENFSFQVFPTRVKSFRSDEFFFLHGFGQMSPASTQIRIMKFPPDISRESFFPSKFPPFPPLPGKNVQRDLRVFFLEFCRFSPLLATSDVIDLGFFQL